MLLATACSAIQYPSRTQLRMIKRMQTLKPRKTLRKTFSKLYKFTSCCLSFDRFQKRKRKKNGLTDPALFAARYILVRVESSRNFGAKEMRNNLKAPGKSICRLAAPQVHDYKLDGPSS